jgi:hypothetical protein
VIQVGLPNRIMVLLAEMVFSEVIGKTRKLGMGVPYMIYVIRVELHHIVSLLRFLYQRNRKHTHYPS